MQVELVLTAGALVLALRLAGEHAPAADNGPCATQHTGNANQISGLAQGRSAPGVWRREEHRGQRPAGRRRATAAR